MDYIDWLFLILPLALLWVGAIQWQLRRSRQVLETWALREGYSITASRHCWFWRGPFVLRSTGGQAVYHVTVADREGHRQSGYVRCGSFLLGLLSSKVDVRWDNGARARAARRTGASC